MSDRAMLLRKINAGIRARRNGEDVAKAVAAVGDDHEGAAFAATLALNPQYAATYIRQATETLQRVVAPLIASGHSPVAIAGIVKSLLAHYPKGIRQAIYAQHGLSAHTATPDHLAGKLYLQSHSGGGGGGAAAPATVHVSTNGAANPTTAPPGFATSAPVAGPAPGTPERIHPADPRGAYFNEPEQPGLGGHVLRALDNHYGLGLQRHGIIPGAGPSPQEIAAHVGELEHHLGGHAVGGAAPEDIGDRMLSRLRQYPGHSQAAFLNKYGVDPQRHSFRQLGEAFKQRYQPQPWEHLAPPAGVKAAAGGPQAAAGGPQAAPAAPPAAPPPLPPGPRHNPDLDAAFDPQPPGAKASVAAPPVAQPPGPPAPAAPQAGGPRRQFGAGDRRGSIGFASQRQADLYDMGAQFRKGMAGKPVAGLSQRQDALAKKLGVTPHDVYKLAVDTHDHVRSQMKGIGEGEHRDVTEMGVPPAAKAPPPLAPTSVAPAPTAKPQAPSVAAQPTAPSPAPPGPLHTRTPARLDMTGDSGVRAPESGIPSTRSVVLARKGPQPGAPVTQAGAAPVAPKPPKATLATEMGGAPPDAAQTVIDPEGNPDHAHALFLAYLDALERAQTATDPDEQAKAEEEADRLYGLLHGEDDDLDPPEEKDPAVTATLATTPPNVTYLALLDTSPAAPDPKHFGEWTRYAGPRGGVGWQNTTTGRVWYSSRPHPPGYQRRLVQASAGRAMELSERHAAHHRGSPDHAPLSHDELKELAGHVQALPVHTLRSIRNNLMLSWGKQPRRAGMVEHLQKHVRGLVDGKGGGAAPVAPAGGPQAAPPPATAAAAPPIPQAEKDAAMEAEFQKQRMAEAQGASRTPAAVTDGLTPAQKRDHYAGMDPTDRKLALENWRAGPDQQGGRVKAPSPKPDEAPRVEAQGDGSKAPAEPPGQPAGQGDAGGGAAQEGGQEDGVLQEGVLGKKGGAGGAGGESAESAAPPGYVPMGDDVSDDEYERQYEAARARAHDALKYAYGSPEEREAIKARIGTVPAKSAKNKEGAEKLAPQDAIFHASTDEELAKHVANLEKAVADPAHADKKQQKRQAKLLQRAKAEQAKRQGGTQQAAQPAENPDESGLPAKKKVVFRKTTNLRDRKSRSGSLLHEVIAYGGLHPKQLDMKAGEAMEDGLPIAALSKKGMALDEMAHDLEANGHIKTPPGMHAGDHLLDLLRRNAKSLHHDQSAEFEDAYHDYLRGVDDARAAGHDPAGIAAAVRQGEADGTADGGDGSLDEIFQAAPGDAAGAGGEGGDAAGDANADDSSTSAGDFPFGANVEAEGGAEDGKGDAAPATSPPPTSPAPLPARIKAHQDAQHEPDEELAGAAKLVSELEKLPADELLRTLNAAGVTRIRPGDSKTRMLRSAFSHMTARQRSALRNEV